MGGIADLILIAALAGFLGTLLCIPRVKRLASELGFLDHPGGRKTPS